jgi:gluconolactonase
MTRILLVAAFCLVSGAQELADREIGRIGAGYRFTEGAAWSKDNFLIFSDTPHDQLLKWVPGNRAEVFREDAHGPSGNAFDVQGRLYTCETRTRRITRTDKTGRIETLADRWDGKRLNAPAAIVVSKSGHIYFTDPAFGYQEDHRELDFYGVYHIPLKGAMEVVAKPAGRPHGIALSPNGRVLYVSNADEHNIRAYDLDRNGEASGERVLVSGIAGIPGGITVDGDGNLYVAAEAISIYNPQGHPLRTFALPDRASSCAFGEGDMKSLFVTARGSVYRLRPDEK